jgi:hypothetical protein
MDSYEIWVDLAPGAHDLEFVAAVRAYLDHFKQNGKIEGYRIRRRKFGFGPSQLGEFVLTLDFANLTQLDTAFTEAATRDDVIESLHREVYSRVTNFKSGLYRDFPDAVRHQP